MSQYVTLEGGNRLEVSTGNIFDQGGARVGQWSPTDVDCGALAEFAAMNDAQHIARNTGKPVRMTDASGDERLVAMDLAVSDVHIAAALPNYAAGYALADSVADIVCPVVVAPKQTDKYFTWDKENSFNRVQPIISGSGGTIAEVSPTLSNASYSTVAYALQSYVSTELASNADAPLRPYQKAIQMVQEKLKLEREFRALTLLATSGNWDSSLVTTLGAAAGWLTGASADPIKDLHDLIDKSYMPVTRIIMSEKVQHAFVRNAAVQKYVAYKSNAAPVPDASQLSALLSLPPITVSKMKAIVSSAATYVLDAVATNSAVILVHEAPGGTADGMDVSTAKTFRWNGGSTPDGNMVAGWLVRTYFDPKRGPRGGNVVVVAHNDAEVMTSKFVGGAILDVLQ